MSQTTSRHRTTEINPVQVYQWIRAALHERDWRLIPDVRQFAQDIAAQYAGTMSDLEREFARWYSAILHAAASLAGSERQNRAYQELWAYLLPIALARTGDPDRAEEYTQRALIRIWERHDQCHTPRRYLGWCTIIVLNEVRLGYREESRRPDNVPLIWNTTEDEESTSGLLGEWTVPVYEDRTAPVYEESARPLEEEIAVEELATLLRAALDASLRSEAQRTVIKELYLRDTDAETIAQMLNTTLNNVYTLKSRALTRLRRHEGFGQALSDFMDLL